MSPSLWNLKPGRAQGTSVSRKGHESGPVGDTDTGQVL